MFDHPALQGHKWKLSAHEQSKFFYSGGKSKPSHKLMMAFLWALYLPQYDGLEIEPRLNDRYRPDVAVLDVWGKPLFWGESGQVGIVKLGALVKRYADTHFAVAKWSQRIEPLADQMGAVLDGVKRNAPFDIIRFDADSPQRFIDADGQIKIKFSQLDWQRLE